MARKRPAADSKSPKSSGRDVHVSPRQISKNLDTKSPNEIGAPLAEASRVHDLVAKYANKAGYKHFQLEFGEDSTGTPAIWVWFIVDDDLKPSQEKLASANTLAQEVRSELIRSEERWPYVNFRTAN